MKKTFLNLLCSVLLLPVGLKAQTPIKSIDKAGNVTYSDRPLPDAVSTHTVAVDPGPSENEREAARERTRRTLELLGEAEAQRKAREEEREKKRQAAKATKPDVVIIKEEVHNDYYSGYGYPPSLRSPLRPKPPLQPELPIYRPPVRPPMVQPVPK